MITFTLYRICEPNVYENYVQIYRFCFHIDGKCCNVFSSIFGMIALDAC